MSDEMPTGFYGKLPALGDFVHRNVTRPEIESIDDWLQLAIQDSQAVLGEQWLDTYLVSPIWCFALQPGIIGENAKLGVFMPSVDRVGRYFPFIILRNLPGQSNVLRAVHENRSWFDSAQETALIGLDDENFDMHSFEVKVGELNSSLRPTGMVLTGERRDFGSAWRLGFNGTIEDSMYELLDPMLQARLGAYSCWWTLGSDHVVASMLVCDGMPSANSFSSMLSGDWQAGGWQNWGDLVLLESAKHSLDTTEADISI